MISSIADNKSGSFQLDRMNLILVLNHSCNLACKYCYGGEKFKKPMPLETGFKAIDYALSFKADKFQLSFFGGEPLLEPELIEKFANYCHDKFAGAPNHPHLQMTTNGTLLNEENQERLAKLKVSVSVSIDGDREAHDANRVFAGGRGSHEAVEKNLISALKRWRWLPTMSVLDPSNIARWPQSFEYLYSLGCKRMHFSTNYERPWSDADLELFEEKARETADKWLSVWRKNEDVRISFFDNKIVTHLKDGLKDCDLCKFGMGEIAVAPSGNFYPCDRLVGEDNREQYVIGDVNKGLDYLKVLKLKEYQKKPPKSCAKCDYLKRCVNFCGCVNHALTGRHDEISGEICFFEQTAIEEADRIAGILYEEKNRLFLERFYNAPSRQHIRNSSPTS